MFKISTSLKFFQNSTRSNSKRLLSFETNDYLRSVIPENPDGHLALVSTSNNIHYNLALENYLAENIDLKNRSILLIWKSDKTIVYGRHQNPWIEINLPQTKKNLVRLARRYSGGGCVYHDLGNLNISFIVDRLKYDREFNLNLIKTTLDNLKIKENYSIELSPRHDIFIKGKNNDTKGYKISGTASRLAKNYSYHHCTLLYESDIENMRYLKSNIRKNITTRATPSVRSKCLNLKDIILEKNFNIDTLIQVLCEEYWRNYSNNWSIDYLFNYIDPHRLSSLFETSLKELESWDFQFSTTPKFQLEIDLNETKIELTIFKGKIKEYIVKDNAVLEHSMSSGLDNLIGINLRRNDLNEAFEKYNLVQLNLKFRMIYDYVNKNIS